MKTKEEIVKLYIEHLIFIVEGEFASLTKTILTEDYVLNGNHLTVYALGNIAVEQLNQNVSKKFEALFKEKFIIGLFIRALLTKQAIAILC